MSNLKPVYLLAGGRPRNPQTISPLLQAVFRESGKVSPTIAYVGTANDDSTAFFLFMATTLKGAGAGKIKHAVISSGKADLKKAQDILNSSDIVYISGGDVERGIQMLQEKNITDFLLELYRQGKPFFGLSAGSIMLAKEWIRWRDPDNDATAEIFPCLGIAPVICDTHGEQDGWEELQALLKLEQANVKGYGIASGTAIKVFPNGRIEVLGGAIHQFIHRGGRVERISDILPVSN
ncbi:MAG: Type 1 glutamine amidotransferase-like domain-containing protein [Chloroflexi bacterium]|nr:Type 1 glutamine amidotransferase-like domain-containing protein [Chloroflexota bacterium]